MQETYNRIIGGIQRYFKQNGFENAVIGVSGGVDSALCLKLTVDALSRNNVTALLMPEKGVSSEENLMHAKALCEYLKIEYYQIPINKYLTDFLILPWKPSDLAQINTKARTRMIILYNFANTRNALVVGTSNKTEMLIGYGTKFGDFAADIEIIGDLYKDEVYELGKFIGLPDEFITKSPTAELYSGQSDEEELGVSYKELDNILRQHEKGVTKDEIISKGLSPNIVHKIFRFMEVNKHKTEPAFLIKVK